MRTRLPI